MTLNSLIALILRFSPISVSLLAKYFAVVEYRPILSVNIVKSQRRSISVAPGGVFLQQCVTLVRNHNASQVTIVSKIGAKFLAF